MKLPKLITGNRFICGLALAMLALFAAPAAHAQQTTCPTGGYTGNFPSWSLSSNCTVNGNIAPSASDINFTMTGGAVLIINGNVTGPGGFGVSATGGSATVNGTVTTATWVYVNADDGFTVQNALTANNGNVQVYSSAGAISIGGAVTSTGGGNGVTMNGLSGVTLGSVNSAYQINLQTGTGTGTSNGTLKISGTAQSVDGAVFLAGQDVSLGGAVTNTGGFDVRVFANQSSAPTTDPFQIGASSPANGVVSITDNNASSTGTIYITNGNGTGGITYSGNDVLQVNASGGTAGVIVLDGQSTSNITLSGTLEANGSSGHSSGNLFFFAPAMTVTSATLNTNAPGQNTGGPAFTTNAITISTALSISNNGNGLYPSGVNMSLFPMGAWSVSADSNLNDSISYGSFVGSSNPLAITGAGSLTINAIGNNNGVKIWGYPLTITPASFTVNQQGSDDIITLGSWNGGSGYNTLTMGGTIAVHVNNNATGQTAGQILVSGTSIVQNSVTSGNILFDVSGYTGTGANGGTITVSSSSGSLALGGSGNNITLNANGSSSGGNGGTVTAGNGGTLAITVNNASPIQASALSGNGNGGTIDINAKTLTNSSSGSVKIAADAFGSPGNGGTIDFNLTGTESFGSSSTSFTAEATGSGTGKGGSITVHGGALTIASPISTPALNVAAGPTNGAGGTINISGSSLTLSGGLAAQGNGTGVGGLMTITTTGSTTFSGTAVTLNASGNASGTGADTAISLTANNAITIGSATGNVELTAYNPGTGDAGSVLINSSNSTITANGSDINVSAGGGNGKGGSITLIAKGAITTSGNLLAQGSGSGSGGNISITTQAQLTGGSASYIADGGSSGGVGGNVSLVYKGTGTVTLGTLSAASSTTGGTISVQNNDNGNLTLAVTTLQTANVTSPSVSRGTTTLTPDVVGSDNVTLTATTINTNLSMTGDVISATASGVSEIGLKNTTGQKSVSVSATTTGSFIEVLANNTVTAANTTVSFSAPTINLDNMSAVTVSGSGTSKNVGFTTNAVNFASGATINVTGGSVAFLSPSSSSLPLTVTVPSGSSSQGVTAATSFIISDTHGVTLTAVGSGNGTLDFISSGSTTLNDIDGSPGPLVNNGVVIYSNASTFDIGLEGSTVGSSTAPVLTEGVTILGTTSSGDTYVQELGTQALTLEASSSSGAFSLAAGGSISATSGSSAGMSSPFEIVAGGSLTFGGSTTTVDAGTVTLSAGSGVLSVASGTILTAANGELLLNNTNSSSGTITVGSATLSSSGSQTGGTAGMVQIAVGATGVETNLDPTDRTAGATVSKNANGDIYWGPTPGASVSSLSVTADGNSGTGVAYVVINSPSGRSAITLTGSTLNSQTH